MQEYLVSVPCVGWPRCRLQGQGLFSQLFVMYEALPEPSLTRMSSIAKNAISMCTTAYLLVRHTKVTCLSIYLQVGYLGYVAFCDDSISGDVLMNFRPSLFSEAVKLGFVLSVALSFPLVIFPCRASLYTLLFTKVRKIRNWEYFRIFTMDYRLRSTIMWVAALFVAIFPDVHFPVDYWHQAVTVFLQPTVTNC